MADQDEIQLIPVTGPSIEASPRIRDTWRHSENNGMHGQACDILHVERIVWRSSNWAEHWLWEQRGMQLEGIREIFPGDCSTFF